MKKFMLMGVLVVVFASFCMAQFINTDSAASESSQVATGDLNVDAASTAVYAVKSKSRGCCMILNNPPRPYADPDDRPYACKKCRPYADPDDRPYACKVCRPL